MAQAVFFTPAEFLAAAAVMSLGAVAVTCAAGECGAMLGQALPVVLVVLAFAYAAAGMAVWVIPRRAVPRWPEGSSDNSAGRGR